MNNLDIQQRLAALQQAVNDFGYNYEITLGFEQYSPCTTWEDFLANLLAAYPAVNTEQLNFLPSTEKEFWRIIDDTLLFQGDMTADSLNKVQPLVSDFKQAISPLIPETVKFYHSYLPNGIPGYPVWWDFSFVIDTKAGSFLFIYGSASD